MPPIYREQPSIRDVIACEVAAALVAKTDIAIDYKSTETLDISYRTKAILARAAKLAYIMADAMLAERRQA